LLVTSNIAAVGPEKARNEEIAARLTVVSNLIEESFISTRRCGCSLAAWQVGEARLRRGLQLLRNRRDHRQPLRLRGARDPGADAARL